MEGSIAKNDLLMITTRLKEAELSVKKAEVNHLTSYQNLNILMGINPNAKIENIENIMTIVNMPQYLPYERALVTRPEYQIANLQINLMQENRKLAISKFNPQITMQIQGGWGTASPNLGYKPTATVIPALTFSMQVWDWGERCKTNRQYKAMVNSYKYNRQIVIDNINKEVANSYTTMDQSYTQINIAKDNLKLAQEALTLNTYSYNEGKINIADLLSSQVSWIQAYSNYIAANYQFKIAIANYLNSLGMIVDGIEK